MQRDDLGRQQTKNPAFAGLLLISGLCRDVVKLFHGAEGGTRTHTLLRAADFESAASTDSATSARTRSIAEPQVASSIGSSFGARANHPPSLGTNIEHEAIGAL